MAKKKSENYRKELLFESYFGESKRYHFFLVKSRLDFYPFALQLNKQLSCALSYSGVFSPCETPSPVESPFDDSPEAVFGILSSPILGVNKGNIYVIENKTTHYNHEFFNKFKQKNNRETQILHLFKERYYLFGNKPPVVWKLPNAMKISVKDFFDYIIIVSHDKENGMVDNLLNMIQHSRLYSVKDIGGEVKTYLHEKQKGEKKGKKNAIDFLLELCQIVEIKKNDFEVECTKKLLGEIKSIPPKNQTFIFPFDVPVQIEDEYISLLNKDISFE